MFRQFLDLFRYVQFPKNKFDITFYSEGRNYWPHIGGLLNAVLSHPESPNVCYFSSDPSDPALEIAHPNIEQFEIGSGFIRNWIFENVASPVLVMTMPDLGLFQIKRSKNKVHYVYVQHSLVSLHMAYRKGAFDNFDTIFCAGPHHVAEIEAMELAYGLSHKNLFNHGYSRIDKILASQNRSTKPTKQDYTQRKRILIAPTWGKHGIIETGDAFKITSELLALGYWVTVRPHPQTALLEPNRIRELKIAFSHHEHFKLETNVVGFSSLAGSDLMLSDWSGAALEYALGFDKPVLFVDTPMKVNNPDYQKIGLIPFEVSHRHRLGAVTSIKHVASNVKTLLDNGRKTQLEECVFNIGKSDELGAEYLCQLVKRLKKDIQNIQVV